MPAATFLTFMLYSKKKRNFFSLQLPYFYWTSFGLEFPRASSLLDTSWLAKCATKIQMCTNLYSKVGRKTHFQKLLWVRRRWCLKVFSYFKRYTVLPVLTTLTIFEWNNAIFAKSKSNHEDRQIVPLLKCFLPLFYMPQSTFNQNKNTYGNEPSIVIFLFVKHETT